MVFDFHFTKFVGKNKDVIDGMFVDGQNVVSEELRQKIKQIVELRSDINEIYWEIQDEC